MPGPLSKSIAATLKQEVEAHGYTQEQVAGWIGRSQPQVSKYLNAEVPLDMEEFNNLCRVLGLNPVTVLADAVTND